MHPEGWTDHQQVRAEVVSAMKALPPALHAVAARGLDGVPAAVVAAELGISVGAAKVRMHRARRLLREAVA